MSHPLGWLHWGPSEPPSRTQARAYPPSPGLGDCRCPGWTSAGRKPVLELRTAGRTWRGRTRRSWWGRPGARTRCPGTRLLTAETWGPQEWPGRRTLPDRQQSAPPAAPPMASNMRFALPMDLRPRVLAPSSSPSYWATRVSSFARHFFSQDGALQNSVTNLRGLAAPAPL